MGDAFLVVVASVFFPFLVSVVLFEGSKKKKSSQNFIGRDFAVRTWSRASARTATARRATRGTATVVRPVRASAAGRRVAAAERAIVVVCFFSLES